ncbi:NAD(P)H-dependent oxidoreductase [Lacticaseibacillus baoqingensis]|uniref:NAD(P)H-dependent oxidoreductase n=1 Tax=Lacticaseibacillus baoqingensis TaxID=2486013 RepID=A0ABW4E2Y2_9LACO|nr:NAD(P)H-dependent oxidoreductase [Lacticaseibacillus baoqingensis]
MKILLIDGYTPHPEAKGQLTHALVATSQQVLGARHQLKTTTMTGYDVAQETEKWQWAELIILHFPVYWYALPWGLKRYLDDVLARDRFYATDALGRSTPLMTHKHFTYVTTLAATQQDLAWGPGIAQLLSPLNASLAFCGVTPAPQVAAHIIYDVYRTQPDLSQWGATLTPLL